MIETNFKCCSTNPLLEISELRFDIKPASETFELICRLRFGKSNFDYKGRQYEVGISLARLRLSLEGCETTLDNEFGENTLEPISEEHVIERRHDTSVEASVQGQVEGTLGAGLNGAIGIDRSNSRTFKQTKKLLPVAALPGNSWGIKPRSLAEADQILEGTAIPSSVLCSLRRVGGSNRMAIVGEVQVSRSDVNVSARGGNKVSNAMGIWQNRDAIVSQILKRAIQREVEASFPAREASAVAISRVDILEE